MRSKQLEGLEKHPLSKIYILELLRQKTRKIALKHAYITNLFTFFFRL